MSELENCCGTTCDKVKLAAEITELKAKIAELQNGVLAQSIADLTRKNSGLMAQINNIHESATEAHEALGFLSHHLRGRMGEAALMDMAEKSDALKEALAATPEQCLAEVKAQAVEDSAAACGDACRSVRHSDGYYHSEAFLFDYADQLRQQAKAGSNG